MSIFLTYNQKAEKQKSRAFLLFYLAIKKRLDNRIKGGLQYRQDEIRRLVDQIVYRKAFKNNFVSWINRIVKAVKGW